MHIFRLLGLISLTLLTEVGMLSHAVAADDRESYLQLAASYENGRGVKKDYREAFRLYCLAARNGEEEAYYSLGWMYFNGRGVPRDMTLAAGWFSKGADAGDRTAANILKKLGNVEPREDLSCPPLLAGKSSDRELIERWVHLLAPEYQLDPELVLAVITAESNFNPKARSPKGALGLMQLIPETAKRFGVKDPLDPLQNLRGGMAYLRWLLDYFDSNVALALAGYNAGEKAVDRHKGIPPYRETRNYVRRITRNLKKTSAVSTGVRLRGS